MVEYSQSTEITSRAVCPPTSLNATVNTYSSKQSTEMMLLPLPSLPDKTLRALLNSETTTPSIEINISQYGSKATVALFAPLSEYVLTGHESGKVAKYSVKTGEQVSKVEESHSGEITDIQLSPDGTYFITSSKDKSAKVGSHLAMSILELRFRSLMLRLLTR